MERMDSNYGRMQLIPGVRASERILIYFRALAASLQKCLHRTRLKCRNTWREHGFRQSWGPAVLAGLKHWCEGWEQMWHCQRNGKSHLWLACLTSVQLLRSTDSQTEMSPITITTESSFCSLTPQLCLPLFRIVVAESGNFLIVSVYFRRNQCV